MRVHFNDDHSKVGVEGWTDVIEDKLIVYVKPTNSFEDWVSDFLAIPVWDYWTVCFIHLGLRKYAHWMQAFINTKIRVTGASEVIIFGFSMGGGIAQILGESKLRKPATIVSIDGPRTTSKITSDCTLYFNRGSLVNRVPFWFKRIKNAICLNDKWRPFWKSHADYDIDEIIKGVIG